MYIMVYNYEEDILGFTAPTLKEITFLQDFKINRGKENDNSELEETEKA